MTVSRRGFIRGAGAVGGIAVGGSALSSKVAASHGSGDDVDLNIYPWSDQPDAATEVDAEVRLRAEQFSFDPSTVEVDQGTRVRILIDSPDVAHGFYVDGYGIETEIPAEEPMIVEFTAARTGSFRFRCSVTCGPFHPFMIGRLVVSPNRRFMGSFSLTGLAGVGILGGIWWRNRDDGGVPPDPDDRLEGEPP